MNDKFAHKVELEPIKHRVGKVEDNQQWVWRSVAGIVLSAVVGTVIVANNFDKEDQIDTDKLKSVIHDEIANYEF